MKTQTSFPFDRKNEKIKINKVLFLTLSLNDPEQAKVISKGQKTTLNHHFLTAMYFHRPSKITTI